MPKERTINPAAAQRKADKAKSIKKGKAQTQTLRNEKLARRNPDRLQRQLDDLKAIETSGGKLTSNEKTILESLEKDIKAVKKAREAVGDRAPKFGGGDRDRREGERGDRGGAGVLGKRRRDGGRWSDSDQDGDEDDVPEDVKRIPMPRDTPPPFPKEVLDKWHQARRDRYAQRREEQGQEQGRGRALNNSGTNANSTPLGANDRSAGFADRAAAAAERTQTQVKPVVAVETKTVYESAPVIRDLRKEAVAFVPAAVRVNLEKGRGVGGLIEPEEADKLEKAGYLGAVRKVEESGGGSGRAVEMEEVDDEDG